MVKKEPLPEIADVRLADVRRWLNRTWPDQIEDLRVVIMNEDTLSIRGRAATPDLKSRVESVLRHTLPEAIRSISIEFAECGDRSAADCAA